MATCETCKYWNQIARIKAVKIGECLVHPPTSGKTGRGVWPQTLGVEWCGAWVPSSEQVHQESRVIS